MDISDDTIKLIETKLSEEYHSNNIQRVTQPITAIRHVCKHTTAEHIIKGYWCPVTLEFNPYVQALEDGVTMVKVWVAYCLSCGAVYYRVE